MREFTKPFVEQSVVDQFVDPVELLHSISGTITWPGALLFVDPTAEAVGPLLTIQATIAGESTGGGFADPVAAGTGKLVSVTTDATSVFATYRIATGKVDVPISVSVGVTDAGRSLIVVPDGRAPGGSVVGIANGAVSATVTLTAAEPRADNVNFTLTYSPPPR